MHQSVQGDVKIRITISTLASIPSAKGDEILVVTPKLARGQ